MKLRVILVCTLLVLAAVPAFALPQCQECNAQNRCETLPGAIEVCYDSGGGLYCSTFPDPCSPPRTVTVLAEWQVVTVDVSRPSLDAAAVTASAPEVEAEACKLVEQK